MSSAIGAALAISITLCLVAGCAMRSRGFELPLEQPDTFSSSGDKQMPDRWWTEFGDDELNRLIAHALQSNFDLATAWQRLRQAQAVADGAAAGLYPFVGADAEFSERRPEREEENDERLRLGLTAEYEVDLWGRIRSLAAAERFAAAASYADYQAAALSLSAEVARAWFQLTARRDQRDLLVEQIETNEQVLELIRSRFGRGQIGVVDVLRQQQLIEATREELIEAETDIQVLEHLLAVLLGRPPQDDVAATDNALPDLPLLPDTGLPIELVQRRPDVIGAYRLLQAADREVAAAIAGQYPQLSLSASLATAGYTADELFEEWIRSFSAGLLAPLFDAGARDAEVDRAEALTQERLFGYAQTTLTAFREVEDALIQERNQLARIRSIEAQIRLADQTYEQLRTEYINGISDYIDVLTTLTEAQQLERDLVVARRDLLEFRISLYRALAGGFETEREME